MDTNGFSAISSLLLRGGSFLSQQNNGASRDRIGNNATVILEGTSSNGLRVSSNQNSTRTESVNKLVLGSGANVITLSNTASSPTAAITTLAFTNATDAFDRLNNATLLVRSGLADLGGSSTSQTTRVTFTSGITSMLVGDGAGSTATNIAILPFVIGGLSDTNHPGNTFVTIGAQGLRPLLDAEYATSYNTAAITDNVSLSASATGLNSATLNSLRINAATANVDITGNAGTSLTLTSGALMLSAAGTLNDSTISGYDSLLVGKADAIADELVIFTTSSNTAPAGATLTISSSIKDNGGAATSLTKAGNGTLVLSGNNSYTGTTTINQGRVEFSSNQNLGNNGPIRMAGGTLAWTGANTTDISTRGVELLSASSYVIPASGSVSGVAVITGNTFDTGANNVTFSQSIGSGGVGGLVKTGTGSLTLQSAATYKGATVIQQGAMNFASIAANTTSALYQVATTGTTSSVITNGLNTGSVITGGAFSTQTGNLVSTLTVNAGDVVIGNGQSDLFMIGYRDTATGGSFSSKGTVNFSAAASVTVNVDRILLGNDLAGTGSGGTEGDLTLSANGINKLTASRMVISDTASPGNTGVTSTLTLGNNSNAIHTDVLLVGGRKSKGEIIGSNGTFELRSQDGEGGANVFIGDNDAATTGTVSTGLINLNGMIVDARINMLTMGRIATGGSSGGAQATLSYDNGLIEATLIRLADPDHKGNSLNDANVRATINQGGTGIMRFLNMSKGNGVAIYNWQGGTIQNLSNADLTNQNVEISLNGTAQATLVDQRKLTVDAGQKATFQSEAALSGTGSFTKDGEGDLTLQGANTNTGNVYIAAGSVSLDGAGSMNDAAWFNIASNAALKLNTLTGSTFSTDAVFSGTGVIDGSGKTLTFTSNVGVANSQSVIRPGASSSNNSLAGAGTVGDQTGSLTIEGDVILAGNTVRVDRAVLQVGATNRNAAATFANYGSLALWVDAIDTDFASFMEGSGTGHDSIDVNGSLTLNEFGGITVTTTGGYSGNFGDVFNLLDWNGVLINNNFTVGSRYRIGTETDLDLLLPTLDAALSWDTSLFADYGVLVVVPEPQRAMLAMVGLLLIFTRRRRK